MKHKKGLKIISLFLFLTGMLIFTLYFYQSNNGNTKAFAGKVGNEPRVNGVLRPGDENNMNATPEYFTFNPNYSDTSWYNHYGSTKFYESEYLGQFYMYSFKGLESDRDLTELDYSQLLENQQKKYLNGPYAVDRNYSWNLDGGYTPLNQQDPYSGYNTGHMTLPTGPYKGYHFEWRYIGYTYMGTEVENPYFPPDVLSSHWEQPWEYKNIITSFWTRGYHEPSPFTLESGNISQERLNQFWDVLFEQYPQYKNRAIQDGADPYEYWSHRAMWEMDPIKGAG